MIIPIQYKYKLEAFFQPVAVYDEATGEYIQPDPDEAKWIDCGMCRDEENYKGDHINTPTGEAYLFSWIVYLPIESANLKIPLGTKLRVIDEDGSIRAEKELMRFGKNQMNVRLWL